MSDQAPPRGIKPLDLIRALGVSEEEIAKASSFDEAMSLHLARLQRDAEAIDRLEQQIKRRYGLGLDEAVEIARDALDKEAERRRAAAEGGTTKGQSFEPIRAACEAEYAKLAPKLTKGRRHEIVAEIVQPLAVEILGNVNYRLTPEAVRKHLARKNRSSP